MADNARSVGRWVLNLFLRCFGLASWACWRRGIGSSARSSDAFADAESWLGGSLDGTKPNAETAERGRTSATFYRDWTSTAPTRVTGDARSHLSRGHPFYQSDRPKEAANPWNAKEQTPHCANKSGRRLSYQEDLPRGIRPHMVAQERKDEMGERPASAAEEPPPPPQPPYLVQAGADEPRGGGGGGNGNGRLDRGERRSIRKLTKDSGYETSQYADSDYANVDWDQSSDRSPTSKSTRSPSSDWGAMSDHEFGSPSTVNYVDRFHPRNTDAWRGAYNKSNYNRSGSSHHWDLPSSWRPSRNESASVRNHNPVHLRNASSSSSASACVSPVRRGAISDALGRYSSTDSLNSASSSSVSFPPASSSGVSSAKSTPSLHLLHPRDEESVPRGATRTRAASAARMSNSSPNLEKDTDAMVTRRTPKTRYETRPYGAVYVTNAVARAAHFWPEDETETLALRSMGVAVYQHTRQVSSQSSGSERTSSSYSQHSRQVSSQSSFSEDDFRIQSIKEEFHQRSNNYDCFPPPPPPYPSKYYSADNLAADYDREIAWTQMDAEGDPDKEPPFPPPPPVRDASSLKYSSRHHESDKFSSWPAVIGDRSEARGPAACEEQRGREGYHQITSAAYEYEFYYADRGNCSDRAMTSPHKKECPPAYEDGPPPPYSPYWSSAEDPANEPARDASANSNDKTATPLMDRLRLETQQRTPANSSASAWNGKDEPRTSHHPYNGRDSVTSSTSSQETLKWHGSTSDLSVQSERTRNQIANATEPATVHSAKVQQPQRHHSESVLYYGNKPQNQTRAIAKDALTGEEHSRAWAERVRKNNAFNAGSATKRRPTHAHPLVALHPEAVAREEIRKMPTPEFAKPLTSVAQRIQHLERLNARANNCTATYKKCKQMEMQQRPRKLSQENVATEDRKLYLDPEKKHRVSDPELKAIQKQAVLSFFERQTNSQKRTQIATQSLPRNYNNAQQQQQQQHHVEENKKTNVNQSHGQRQQNDARVAIYYNTFTQTQMTGEEQTPKDKKGNSPCNAPSLKECQIKGEASNSDASPRKDIALQTDWTFARYNDAENNHHLHHQQRKSTRNGEMRVRESTPSRNPRPPERPPKRPHLQQLAPISEPPPPPLLPRASPSVASARAAVVVPATPSPDEDAEDQELLRIEESARQLRNLEPPPPSAIARPPPPCIDLIDSRGSTPDLPLPPPPPPLTEEEIKRESDDGDKDVPLPPPPSPAEVKTMVERETSPERNDSSASDYPEDNYMSYRNERRPDRRGFEGSYHRSSPDVNGEMEASPPPLTPSGWEKWHKIGRTGATVVFSSSDMKPSGALKPLNGNNNERETRAKNNTEQHVRPETSKVVSTRRTHSDASSSASCNVNEKNNETHSTDNEQSTKENSNLRNGRRSSLDSLNSARVTPRVNREADDSSRADKVISSRTTKQGPSPSSPDDDSSSSSSSCSSSSSARTPTEFVQDLRKNSATQTQTSQQQQKHVEVTTQTTPSVSRVGRTRRQEEVECDLLSKDLARQLPEEEKALQALLIPCQLKTTADYMQGLFPSTPTNERSTNRVKTESCGNATNDASKRSPEVAVLPADSAYFTTSESKARFLTRYSKDMSRAKVMDVNTAELGKKKEDLVSSIGRKLEILRSEQLAIQDEIQANEELGRSVTSRVEKLAKKNELEKYKLHVEEIDKITSLLLGLSGRLARAENALMGLAEESSREDRDITRAKRDKLFDQHEEAKRLKENIDRRSEQVSNFLHKYLSCEEYADYDHFVRMKSKLLIDCKEIDDRIKLGEEQMLALKNNLGKNS